jgi:hypothetical protein
MAAVRKIGIPLAAVLAAAGQAPAAAQQAIESPGNYLHRYAAASFPVRLEISSAPICSATTVSSATSAGTTICRLRRGGC